MQIRKGNDRIVFVFPSLGIVVKLPIVHFFFAARCSWQMFFHCGAKGRRWKILKRYLEFPTKNMSSFRWFLFRGLSANWNEFRFYRKTKNPFLQPTYFSLFGLLNIQRFDEPCQLEETGFWWQLLELTNGKVSDDGHHFEEPRNFCFHNGKLRILDYGSRRTHDVVLQYGTKIVELFNPEYSKPAR
ncbi:hypothetical protein A2609_01525 [Candidatus Kaiserbacteria bacterium RIFOXYD1_FULL_47_14]|uniref:Uncharacterized protein n=1 Tax=Candidatus Kaiserbacteria bacterium RIFOXYD1_FULL_47_14 TaxID=1798533 RepID=A0A1F6G5G7_9BACT|nr:MAG: hypothetical protein A2609_01525 [Candidatus Kaiserbacteria bacterium RIFOXYD1_FULL_47_14]